MFTGIVTDVGEVKRLTPTTQGQLHRLRVGCHYDRATIKDGASIACNGVCLTVVASGIEGGKTWFEVDVYRIAGEIARQSPNRATAKAETYFEHALAVARQQQAKSWELRAAMSMARLWYDQGKVQQARELLAPVYSWFTEGFDTRDLKEAKALLVLLAPAVN